MNGNSRPLNSRRWQRPTLRQATFILPSTGERVRRAFTLRSPPIVDDDDERAPLLGNDASASATSPRKQNRAVQRVKHVSHKAYELFTSKVAVDLLKCSIAYLLGSMATFVPPVSAFLGNNDGKHMVATVTVYFHPARSTGSMIEATYLAIIAFVYATVLSFASMAVSIAFRHLHLLQLGHAIVLVVFLGGGFGLIGWIKQKLGNPLVNVACSLTSLALITVLTKEGAVQAGHFSYNKIFQVLKMVIMGIIASFCVNLIIRPYSARKLLRDNLRKGTDSLGDMLTMITRSFLSGSEEELKHPEYQDASKTYKTVFNSMKKNLGEAKNEHFILGTEKEYRIEARLVKCMERLSQNIGALRGAALTQFTLISKPPSAGTNTPLTRVNSSEFHFTALPSPRHSQTGLNHLAAIEELGEESDGNDGQLSNSGVSYPPSGAHTAESPSDIFTMFISHLGPSMKSLAFTLKEVLDELPFGPPPEYKIAVNRNFRGSLLEANELFKKARREALAAIYANRSLNRSRPVEVLADYEEVAASCGYFSSALQDFAEEMIVYLDILDELKTNLAQKPRKRSWNWILFWRKNKADTVDIEEYRPDTPDIIEHNETQGMSHGMPDLIRRQTDFNQVEKIHRKAKLTYRLWQYFAFLRREDLKYATKVGVGAMLYAMWSYVPETRPIYSHWRGEWGLVSYMLVCSMTIGASNTTGIQRFAGTCLGAVFAVISWTASRGNAYALAFFGWLVSLYCFHFIVAKGKGPMGRFILLTYNLSCLYAYTLSVREAEGDDDEGGDTPAIVEIALHRVVAVISGCIWGIVITRVIWPNSARQKIKDGICILWLRMGLIWKRDPLAMLVEGASKYSYMDIRESIELQRFLTHLEALRKAATSEFEFSGPFPNKIYGNLLSTTGRMLDAFHAMNVLITKDLKATPGERELLHYTRNERIQLSSRISHLFSVMASSMKLEYPLNDALPSVDHTRDRLLAKIFEFRKNAAESDNHVATDEDYELLYAYALVTGQLAQDIANLGQDIEQLYGVLNEDNLKLQ
ncbi:Fusaric acid resistance protein-like-domain-containing protein [Phyllosticta capitalensis]|uniref:Fusaric acid resistance protein-like-domain-containing protein n=1 Tax=Phyllosticta capitalensis TaxID=121624 RepID=A0ABR1YE61_9PEZI